MPQNQLPREEQNHNFSEFDLRIVSFYNLNDEVSLPILIDIADVNFKEYTDIHLHIIKQENRIVLDERNPYYQDYLVCKQEEEIKKYIKYIDDKTPLFEGKTLSEHLGKDIYSWLIEIGIDEVDFINFREFIIRHINHLTNIFNNKANEYFAFSDKKSQGSKTIHGISPENYDFKQTQTYNKIQTMIDYQNATPIFPENLGRAFSDYSWREIQVRMKFLHRKNQIDNEMKNMEGDINKAIMGEKSDSKPFRK